MVVTLLRPDFPPTIATWNLGILTSVVAQGWIYLAPRLATVIQRYREKPAICPEEQVQRVEDFRQAAAVPLSRLEIDSEAWRIFERHRHLSGYLTLAEMDAEMHARAHREFRLVQRSGNTRP